MPLLHRPRILRWWLSRGLIPDLADLVLEYATEPWRKSFGRGCRVRFTHTSTWTQRRDWRAAGRAAQREGQVMYRIVTQENGGEPQTRIGLLPEGFWEQGVGFDVYHREFV
jgi:hypothetical protein